MNSSRSLLVIGGLVVVEAALLFVPLAILGAAINWPDSLDFAPSKVDVSRFSAAPSSHLSGYPFESQGAFPA